MDGARSEVAWLRRHNFAVWILHEERVVDARALAPHELEAGESPVSELEPHAGPARNTGDPAHDHGEDNSGIQS